MTKTRFCVFIANRARLSPRVFVSAAFIFQVRQVPPFSAARRRRRSRPAGISCLHRPDSAAAAGGGSVCKLAQLCVCTEPQLCVGPVRGSAGQPGSGDLYADDVARRTAHRHPGAPLCVLSPACCSESWSHQVRRVDGAARAADLLHLSRLCVRARAHIENLKKEVPQPTV